MARTARFPLLVFGLLVPLSAAASPGNAPPLGQAPLGRAESSIARVRAEQAALDLARRPPAAAMVHMAGNAGFRVLSSKGSVEIKPSAATVTVRTELTIKNQTAGLKTLHLYVYPDLPSTAGWKLADTVGLLTTRAVGQGIYSVTLRKALAQNATIKLVYSYSGAVNCAPSGASPVRICAIGAYQVYNVSGAWQAALVNSAMTDLVYPEAATLQVIVPSTMELAASGRRASVKTLANKRRSFTYHKDSAGMHQGWFSFAAAPYKVATAAFDGGKVARAHILGPSLTPAVTWAQAAAEIMTTYKPLYGAYPLSKIDVSELPSTIGAGGLSTPSSVYVASPYLPSGNHWSNRLVLAHELSHQWFGSMIHRGDSYSPWLSEGFATFSEMVYTGGLATKAMGSDYMPTYRTNTTLGYIYAVRNGQDAPMTSPQLFKIPRTNYVYITYNKGAMVVNLIHYILGNTGFYKAMRQYRADHLTARTTVPSLLASIKKASGHDLTSFANTWVHQAGYPTYTAKVVRGTKPDASGQYTTKVTVQSSRAMVVRLELELVLSDGRKLRKTMMPPGKARSGTWATPAEVAHVRVDPDARIPGLKRGNPTADVYLDGEVDGIDLIYTAAASGQSWTRFQRKLGEFSPWADLQFDSVVDYRDVSVVQNRFGSRNK